MNIPVQDKRESDRTAGIYPENLVYITPGDKAKESYRLCTLANITDLAQWQQHCFAACGFYCTGNPCKIECFSCGYLIENPAFVDCAKEGPWHKDDCLMRGELSRRKKGSYFPFLLSGLLPHPFCLLDDEVKPSCSDCGHGRVLEKRGAALVEAGSCSGRTESDALPDSAMACSEQSGKYVFMDNPRREISRLATFTRCSFPFTQSMRHAALDGLYYTGCNDTAKCFCCGSTWAVTDCAYTTNLHASDCAMMMRTDHSNIPFIGLGLTEWLRDILYASSVRWQLPPSPDEDQSREGEPKIHELPSTSRRDMQS